MTRPNAPPPDGPKAVSRFEYNLLCILRFLLGHYPAERGLQLLRQAAARPPCLTAAAIGLAKDSLAKGCVLFLVRAGGWRDERFLRGREPSGGRVWERVPLDERSLRFSGHVVEFLLWATAERAHETSTPWDAPPAELTAADELFFWLAFDAARADGELLTMLRQKAAFRRNPFLWLTTPADLCEPDEETTPSEFAPLFAGTRAAILECLQPHLTARWLRSERAKGQQGDWRRMRHQGRVEAAALGAFLAAAQAAGRTDLARWVLQTNSGLFRTELAPAFWTGGLPAGAPGRLADRLDAQRAALAVPRQMETLAGWQAAARGVGYFDDDYAASQLWKQTWEAADGDAVATRAAAAVAALDPLRSGQRAEGRGQTEDATGPA